MFHQNFVAAFLIVLAQKTKASRDDPLFIFSFNNFCYFIVGDGAGDGDIGDSIGDGDGVIIGDGVAVGVAVGIGVDNGLVVGETVGLCNGFVVGETVGVALTGKELSCVVAAAKIPVKRNIEVPVVNKIFLNILPP